jgi:hypothetical protein
MGKSKSLPLAMIAIELAFDAEYCKNIPDSPESFAKAIQRERRNWGDALNNSRSFT